MTATLAYDDCGTGVPVVLLHGLTFERTTWRPIVDRLGDRVRTVALDLPGHGDTGGSPRHLEDIAVAVHDVVERLGAEPPVVVGHSMSGGLALRYAATYPARGAVTVDGTADLRPFARLLQQLAPGLRGDGFTATFDVFQQSMRLDLVPEPLRSQVLARQTVTPELVLGSWDEVLRSDPEELQARIEKVMESLDIPVLAYFGHEAPGEREYLEAHIANVAVEEWPGRGHLLHLVEPDRFAARLAAFIEACPS
jgi:pimeloyl-ACP methyl ester carboxylesterase